MDWLSSVPTGLRWAITLAFAGLIVVLSVTPGVEKTGDSMFVWLVVHTATPLQKLLHVGIYAALAMLWMWTLEPIESRLLRITLTLIASVGLGALLEWHQTRVPGRFGTVFDVILNAAGAVVGLLLAVMLL